MKLKDLAGTEIELTDLVGSGHYPMPVIYVSDTPEMEGAYVEWIEPLGWHLETWQNLTKALRLERFGDYRYPLWTRVLSDQIIEVFEEEGELEEGSLSVDDASAMLGDDERGGIQISMQLPQNALFLEEDSEELMDMAWDFIATCQNLTDPGTFGWVYLFAEVARKLNIEWTDEVREAGGVRSVMV